MHSISIIDKKEKHRLESLAYRKTEAYKIYMAEYSKRPDRIARQKIYQNSDKHQNWLMNWLKSDKGKFIVKTSQRKYHQKESYKEHQKTVRNSHEYKSRHSEYKHSYLVSTKYGISKESYNLILKEQGGGCAICGGNNCNGRRLGVDHSHETGKVRGLLCGKCNAAMGNVGDNIYRVLKLAEYLLERGE